MSACHDPSSPRDDHTVRSSLTTDRQLLAELERELIRERTHAGLKAARARGRHGGRRSVMTPDKIPDACTMYDSRQHSVEAVAQALGVSRAAIYRAIAEPATPVPWKGAVGAD